MEHTTDINKSRIKYFHLLLFSGLAGIVMSLLCTNYILLASIVLLPFLLIILFSIIKSPIVILYILFIVNYFIMGIVRYKEIDGISVLIDNIILICFIMMAIHSKILRNINWKPGFNYLTIWALLWMLYCIGELFNPTGVINGWISSRGYIFNGLLVSLIASVLCNKYKIVKTILIIFSILSLLAVIKAFLQKFSGFDTGELIWLAKGGAKTHIIRSGTRYFSFFTDAGNFGSNMGCSCIVLAISAFFIKNKGLKIFYLLVSAGSFYAMLLSGTRGAIIVPLGGLALLTVISKNIKIMICSGLTLLAIYVFFAFTMIGQGNAQIRRMRTAFTPSQDASYLVRKENQRRLGTYLKYKPFGEGPGLSGQENRKISQRFTTSIPNDSWYVKLWVETGIVGLILYVGGLFIVIAKGAWVIMFKIKNTELKGILTAMLCGVFGLLLSAYGNPFWGQYPTMIIAFVCLSFVLKGEYFDKQIEENKDQTKIMY